MPILLTNINENTLNQDIIEESFTKLENIRQLKNKKISEIFYLNEKTSTHEWNFKNIKVNKFKIAMEENTEKLYNNISEIIKDILEKEEFLNVIVDNSFLAYIILEILIKKFNIKDVFILENNQLKKAHPCGCGEEYIGF